MMCKISGVQLCLLSLFFCVKDRYVDLLDFLYHLLTYARRLLFQKASESSHIRHHHLIIHSEILNSLPPFNLKLPINWDKPLNLKEGGKFEQILIGVVGYLPEIFLIDSLLDRRHVIEKVRAFEVHLQVVRFVQDCKEGVEGVSPQDGPFVLAWRLEEEVVCPWDMPLRFMSHQKVLYLPWIWSNSVGLPAEWMLLFWNSEFVHAPKRSYRCLLWFLRARLLAQVKTILPIRKCAPRPDVFVVLPAPQFL